MHCLPMVKGKEISEEMAEHPNSVIFRQSENRLHAQKAVLLIFWELPELNEMGVGFMSTSEGKSRLEALRKLLSQGKLSTQDELREELEARKFAVTQSTISRDSDASVPSKRSIPTAERFIVLPLTASRACSGRDRLSSETL